MSYRLKPPSPPWTWCTTPAFQSLKRVAGGSEAPRQSGSSHSPWHFRTQSQVLSTPVRSPPPTLYPPALTQGPSRRLSAVSQSPHLSSPPGERKGGSWATLVLLCYAMLNHFSRVRLCEIP